MNSKKIIIKSLCRTCMSEEADDIKAENKKENIVTIFGKTEYLKNNITLLELLKQTTPQLNIEKDDVLPKIICELCVEKLIKANEFQKMCIKSEQKLREIILEQTPATNPNDTNSKNSEFTQSKNDRDEQLIDPDHIDDFYIVSTSCDIDYNESPTHTDDINYVPSSSDDDLNYPSSSCDGNDNQFNVRISAAKSKSKRKQRNSQANEKSSYQFKCDECGSRLKTLKSLGRHKKIHLRPFGIQTEKTTKITTQKIHECEYCKKVFQKPSLLNDHIRLHTGELPYQCDDCGKFFRKASTLKQHLLRHGTYKSHLCPDCPKSFYTSSDLSSHKAVHTKTKSHVCDVCGAGFVKAFYLKEHKMYHTGEKNHKCRYCNRRFVTGYQCRRHMRTHTGEKPHKCKYCERAFAQSNDLMKHLRNHLGDNVYRCSLCPQGFRLDGDLRKHFNTHKNDDKETKLRNLQALKDEDLRLEVEFGLA